MSNSKHKKQTLYVPPTPWCPIKIRSRENLTNIALDNFIEKRLFSYGYVSFIINSNLIEFYGKITKTLKVTNARKEVLLEITNVKVGELVYECKYNENCIHIWVKLHNHYKVNNGWNNMKLPLLEWL